MYDEYEHPLAEPGYQSDTGNRDTPTRQDFVNYTRVEEIHGKPRSKKAKVMNRRGRAICRIMTTHGWTHADIGYVFRISEASVKRAVDNRKYNPRDRVEEDKERAGPDFHSNLPMPPSDERRAELRKLDDTVPKVRILPGVVYSHFERSSRVFQASKVIYLVSDDSSDSDSSEEVRIYTSAFNPLLTSEPPKDQLPDEAASPPLFPYQVNQVDYNGHENIPHPSIQVFCPAIGISQTKLRSSVILQFQRSQLFFKTTFPTSVRFIPWFRFLSPRISVEVLMTVQIHSRLPNRYMLIASQAFIPSPLPAPSPRKPLPLPLPPVHTHPHPHSNNSPTPDPDPALPSFLQTISDIDYTPHLPLLALQGFTLVRMRAVSTWTREEMHEALEGLLMGRGAAEAGQPGMRAIASVSLEIAIRGLKSGMVCLVTKITQPALPPSGSSSGTTLPSFLQNVMGLDLSPHLQLFEEQDIDMRMLGAMVRWDRDRREETLRRVLLQHESVLGNGFDSGSNSDLKRMTALEVVGLEFCLRRAGGEVMD
ncbi:hypothetical protein R3P38DRAFT_2568039 [Favolaschia claudopus]|uniref:Uncharacterized protein n=1 Tax=Favolaschia claudopus TaxID=2862362 RepID=A0AAV9ZVU8_9AGAR